MIKELSTKGRVLYADCETKSLNLATSRPFEFAYILTENDKIVKKEQHFLWWPDLSMSADAARITRFDFKIYKERAEDPHKVYEEVKDFFWDDKTKQVGQNYLNFDIYQIKNWFQAIGKWKNFGFTSRTYDTNALSKAYLSGDFPNFDNFLSWQYKWLNFRKKGLKSNLSFLCKEFNIEFNEDLVHEALEDIELTRQVFKKLIYFFQKS